MIFIDPMIQGHYKSFPIPTDLTKRHRKKQWNVVLQVLQRSLTSYFQLQHSCILCGRSASKITQQATFNSNIHVYYVDQHLELVYLVKHQMGEAPPLHRQINELITGKWREGQGWFCLKKHFIQLKFHLPIHLAWIQEGLFKAHV